MSIKLTIFAINGSASSNSSNQRLLEKIASLTGDYFRCIIFNDLKLLPHFDPGLSDKKPPREVELFREKVQQADGILICTPEYVFSIPSGLKNAIEWCISTTIFTDKPTGIITASAHGQKGHEELQLIMKTVMAKFTPQTTLLIQGVKGKVSTEGQVTDKSTEAALNAFIHAFKELTFGTGN
jgi:NAD(P)H-dependent FMN reductase